MLPGLVGGQGGRRHLHQGVRLKHAVLGLAQHCIHNVRDGQELLPADGGRSAAFADDMADDPAKGCPLHPAASCLVRSRQPLLCCEVLWATEPQAGRGTHNPTHLQQLRHVVLYSLPRHQALLRTRELREMPGIVVEVSSSCLLQVRCALQHAGDGSVVQPRRQVLTVGRG